MMNANDRPDVSIIVRTYNRPERLQECLQSLRNQTYGSFEVVIVNDAGEDVEHLIPVELGTIPYRYVMNPQNLGRTAALNAGVEAAAGNYIGFLDDDDAVYPDHIKILAETAINQGESIVYTDVINVTFKYDDRTNQWMRIKEELIYSFDFSRDNFLLANYIPITCLLIRRGCFDVVGPFDESLLVYEDWEFLIRLSRKFSFKHIPKITGEYRRRDDNSNILEQYRYPVNERAVKRRYRDERDASFDPIFKLTFQQNRDMRNQKAEYDRLLQQAKQLQIQFNDMRQANANLQQEVVRLRTEKQS